MIDAYGDVAGEAGSSLGHGGAGSLARHEWSTGGGRRGGLEAELRLVIGRWKIRASRVRGVEGADWSTRREIIRRLSSGSSG